MASELQSLIVQIDANVERLRREMSKADKAVGDFDRSTTKRLSGIDRAFARAGKNIARSFGTALAAISLGGLASFAASSIAAADAINTASINANIAAERFQRLQFAAEQSDLSAREFEEGMRRLNRRFGEFINSAGGPGEKAFRALGIDQDVLAGKITNTEQVFDAIIARIGDYGDASQQSALLAQAFGDDAGPKFAQLIALGTDALKELEARATGVYSQETLDKADALNNKFNELSRIVGTSVRSAFVNASLAAARFFGVFEEDQIARRIKVIDASLKAGREIKGLFDTGDLLDEASIAALKEERADLIDKLADKLPPLDVGALLLGTTKDTPAESLAKAIAKKGGATSGLLDDILISPNALEKLARRDVFDNVRLSLKKVGDQLEANDRATQMWQQSINNALSDAIFRARSFGDILSSIGRQFLSAALFGGNGTSGLLGGLTSGISKSIGGFFSGIGFGRATGGSASGATLVGERGPEIVNLPAGSRVSNAADTRSRSGGASVIVNQTIAPQFAGNAATQDDLIRMGQIARQSAIDGVMTALSRPRFA